MAVYDVAMKTLSLRKAHSGDYQSIADIYNYYIENTVITFEEASISAVDIAARVEDIQKRDLPWLVAEEDKRVIGYAYAGPWNKRSAYRHSIEISIYLAHQHTGNGLGTRLYEALFTTLRGMNFHMVIAGVTLPNPASVAIHEKFGMKKVAHFEEVGFKFGQWLDVGYWQVAINECSV